MICSINGTAGVGKSALAVHFAHQVAERFPDGQLYLDLRGHNPQLRPLTPPRRSGTCCARSGRAPPGCRPTRPSWLRCTGRRWSAGGC